MGLTQRPDSDYVKFRVIESEDGKSLVLASEVHTSPQMWKRYNHIREEDLTQAANRLGEYLQQHTPGTLDGVPHKG